MCNKHKLSKQRLIDLLFEVQLGTRSCRNLAQIILDNMSLIDVSYQTEIVELKKKIEELTNKFGTAEDDKR